MLRRCRVFLQENWSAGKNPNVGRHAQSTFHEGVHREPPRPTRRPWGDNVGPYALVGHIGPNLNLNNTTVKVFVIGSLICVSYYAFCLSFDIKAHYLMNNNMHRNLHLQRAKTEELEQRCAQLERALEDAAVKIPEGKVSNTNKDSGNSNNSSISKDAVLKNDPAATGVPAGQLLVATNYEFELSRERARAKELHHQHQRLVHELADVRAENTRLKKQLASLTVESEQLQRLVDKFHRAADS